jgi:hypothetical protein
MDANWDTTGINSEELKRARLNWESNKDLARQIYDEEIAKGNSWAMFCLARHIINENKEIDKTKFKTEDIKEINDKNINNENIKFAINLMTKSADLLNPRAIEYLAWTYREGKYTEKNYSKSVEYFKHIYYTTDIRSLVDIYNIAIYNEEFCEIYMEMYKNLEERQNVDPYDYGYIMDRTKPIMKMNNIPVISIDDICSVCEKKLFCTYNNVKILTCGHMYHELCCSDECYNCNY